MADPLAETTLLDTPTAVQRKPGPDEVVARPEAEDLEVREAGEGQVVQENPLGGLIRTITKEEFDAVPTRAAGNGAAGDSGGLISFAKKFVGTPYKWGGSSPLGFDCSGFTQYVFKQAGINLPRISYQQGQGGQAVSTKAMQPGDLVFWDNSSRNNGADHVAIYIGGGQVISAPKPGDRVKIQPLYGNYFVRRYA
jgi:cell wall-associated NlpC family hydrolase